MNTECQVEFCGRPTREGRKWCPGHKEQIQKKQTLRPVMEMRQPTDDPEIWFWRFVEKTPECWLWTRSTSEGYGVYTGRGRGNEGAHRVAYEFSRGTTLRKGQEVDHICRNRICVRPDHLRVATRSENAQNLPVAKNSSTGVRGVTRTKNGKFQAQVQVNTKYKYLGTFDTIEEAGAVATQFRKEHFPYFVEGDS